MSVHGPNRRYAPVRGAQGDVLRHLRRGDWTKGIPALAAVLGRPEANIWHPIVTLDARRLLRAVRSPDGSVRIWITNAGRQIRL